jgi:ribonuclease D
MHSPITDAATLHTRLQNLSGATSIGLDTEFLRERTYYAQLCLLQLSDQRDSFCIDTLALNDGPALDPLRALLGHDGVCKVIHAARQDLEVLAPLCGEVRNVFDTQLAAALVGFPPQVGYAALVEALLQVRLHKTQTRTDWSRRPLSQAQIDYALDDVRHLLPLRELLLENLKTQQRLTWFEEETQAAAAEPLQVVPERAWQRLKGLSDLDEPRQRLAQSLAAWRETRAIHSDRPRGWRLADLSLREIVAQVPRTLDALRDIPDLGDGVVKHCGAQLLALVEAAGIAQPPPPMPRRERPSPEFNETVKRLGAIVRQQGEQLRLAPEVLATRRDLENIAGGARTGGVFSGWRNAIIGQSLLEAL